MFLESDLASKELEPSAPLPPPLDPSASDPDAAASHNPQELTLSYLCENPKPSLPSEAKRKEVEDPDRRWVERDFLHLSGAGRRDAPDAPVEKKPKIETLSLSLAPPDLSLSLDPAAAAPAPPPPAPPQRRAYSNNTTTRMTASDDFAPSLSCSYSLPFSHNPSCSLTRNSTDNYCDTNTNDQIWHAGEGTNGSVHSRFRPVGPDVVFAASIPNTNNNASNNSKEMNNSNNGTYRPTNSVSESHSFFPSELPAKQAKVRANGATASSDGGRNVLPTGPDRVLREIVSESVHVMAQILGEFPSGTLESLKECLRSIMSAPEKKDELARLQRRLERRSDITAETLSKSHRTQLEILVAIKTGVLGYLSGKNRIPNAELVEIFSLLRCRNVNCKSLLPVDDCDCKICSTKKGFCSACMCPVCFEFDCASNTCSWVGCDVCSHWCHAVCGIEKNLIRPAPSAKGGPGMTEMQFQCLGCGHDSEMFGFVKEVFQCCAKDWGLETLMKELDCVVKIFQRSEDFEGKELQRKAEEVHTMLGKKFVSPLDACNGMLEFFKYGASDFSVTGSSSKKLLTAQACQIGDALPVPPPTTITPLKSTFNLKPASSNLDTQINALKTEPKSLAPEPHFSQPKEDGFQSLETMVKFKEAEARLFQRLADDARREVEGYRQIVRAKSEKLEEEYATKLAKLCLQETEERRRKKLEELKFLENSHCDYHNMKMRMQAEIASLLERMEATRKQWV